MIYHILIKRCQGQTHLTQYHKNDMGKEHTMLKGIPQILSPELLKVLCEMGHSDRLVISDGNFPA